MRLTDLLQLINDLNTNTKFYLKINEQILPWGKLTLENDKCLLYPGKIAMTKNKLIKLVAHIHGRGIPLRVKVNEQEIPLFGLQIREDSRTAVLM